MIDPRSVAAVALLAVVAHATALGGGHVWLDHAHLERGLALAPPGDFGALFTQGFAGTGFYRPLVSLSLSLDALVSRSPGFFRATTLAWHALASVMTLVAARRLGASQAAALVAALLFAVHPVTSLVAAATAFRSEAMLLVFLLGLVVAHRAKRPMFAGVLLAAAALTKETGWVLGPLFVVALEVERSVGRRGPFATPLRRRLLAAEFLAFVVAGALRLLYAPEFRADFPTLSGDEHVGSRLAAFGKSTLSLLAPFDASVCDAFPATSTLSFGALFGALSLFGVALLVVKSRRPLAWLFALSLLPALELVPVMRFWSPHYLYVPLAFGTMLLAREIERRGPRVQQALVVVGAVFLGLSLVSGRRFTSDERLFAPEVAHEPACREGHFYLGEVARERGDWARAAYHYERASTPTAGIIAYVDQQAALQNLGAARFAQKRHADAKLAWRSALSLATEPSDRRELEHNLAVLALETGDPGEAVRLLDVESKRDDALPEALFVRAKALHELGREREAVALVARLRTASVPSRERETAR